MISLAIDTSTLTASVAITRREECLALIDEVAELHSDVVLSLIERALASAAVDKRQIERVCVGVGPGSFTGLRIGLATAKGIALARGVPVVGADSLAALALVGDGALRVPVLDARRGEVFAAAYAWVDDRLRQVHAPIVLVPAAVPRFLDTLPGVPTVFGDALLRYPDLAPSSMTRLELRRTPSAFGVARLAEGMDLLRDGTPFYIRPSEAEVNYPDGVPGAVRQRS